MFKRFTTITFGLSVGILVSQLLMAADTTTPKTVQKNVVFSKGSTINPSTPIVSTATPSTTPTHAAKPVIITPKDNKAEKSDTKQVLNYQNADIRAVIQSIAELTGKSFILDPRVQGRISVISSKPLSKAGVYQVFLSMLQVLNFSAIPSGNVIKIVPSMNARELGAPLASQTKTGVGDEVVVRVVPISNVSANDLVPVIRQLMPEWATVTAYTPSNSLILAGAADNINKLVAIINKLDQHSTSQIEIVRLSHGSAENIVNSINALQTSNRSGTPTTQASLAADNDNNSILISGSKDQRNTLKKLIRKLDAAGADNGGNIEVKQLNYRDAKDMASILTKVANADLAQSKPTGAAASSSTNDSAISIQSEKDNNALIINAPAAVMTSLNRVIRELDVAPSQVLVEAIIAQVDEKEMSNLGVIWGTAQQDSSSTEDANGNIISGGQNTPFQQGVGFIPNGNIQAVIQALASNASTDILATPSIVVLNNNQATISDGVNVGLENRTYSSTGPQAGGSTVPFTTTQRTDVTLSLKVTPKISPNDSVIMKIDQQDKSLANSSGSSPQDNPAINVSQIKTNVMVKNHAILVLGGLISNTKSHGDKKIPILGDIPILGRIFHVKSHAAEKKDLMVFIRPVILRNKSVSDKQTDQRYHYIRNEEIKHASGESLIKPNESPVLPGTAHTAANTTDLPTPFTEH